MKLFARSYVYSLTPSLCIIKKWEKFLPRGTAKKKSAISIFRTRPEWFCNWNANTRYVSSYTDESLQQRELVFNNSQRKLFTWTPNFFRGQDWSLVSSKSLEALLWKKSQSIGISNEKVTSSVRMEKFSGLCILLWSFKRGFLWFHLISFSHLLEIIQDALHVERFTTFLCTIGNKIISEMLETTSSYRVNRT